MINAIYIETVDAFPDTTITLTNGRKFIVKEEKEIVASRIQSFYRSINLLGRTEVHDSEE